MYKRQVLAHDAPADAYAGVTAEVLLVTGARSPAYFTRASEAMALAVPAFRHGVIPKANHNALMDASAPLVERVAAFISDDFPAPGESYRHG